MNGLIGAVWAVRRVRLKAASLAVRSEQITRNSAALSMDSINTQLVVYVSGLHLSASVLFAYVKGQAGHSVPPTLTYGSGLSQAVKDNKQRLCSVSF